METTPFFLNISLPIVVPEVKSGVLPADIVEREKLRIDGNAPVFYDDFDNSEPDSSSDSIYMMIFIPLASVVLIAALAATARWRYNIRNQTRPDSKDKGRSNNNNNIVDIEQGNKSTEEVPLKRTSSTSSSSSAVSQDFLVEGSLPVTVSMRIVPDVKTEKESSRSDFYCELKQTTRPDCDSLKQLKETPKDKVSGDAEAVVLKERSPDNSASFPQEVPEAETKTVKFLEDRVEFHPRRPQTLEVKTAVNSISEKGFPWAEQLWTPDADIIYEETDSPATDHPGELNKEGRDCLFPLMAKGRFKMKPKGLLERRGSNVALTISLKNEEKTCASPPPSSQSPKPLVYLRTATAKLDPLQLHIKSSDTSRLQQEFWEVPMNHPSEKHFSIPGYGTKNRYRSILPNPHSRVLLPATPNGDPLSAYINANYVRGYSGILETERRRMSEDGKENDARRMSLKRKARYIATQGPMANTVVDFWKMIWKENSNTIVMITKLKERKEKCSEYIPNAMGEKQTYENFEVEITDVRHADHYTVRKIELRNSEEEGVVHYISHFWYSEWLDHETPEKLRGLLNLIQEVETTCPDSEKHEHGPVITHCSAGIGRTGCLIAISIGCAQLRAETKVDVLKIICQLRMDRGGMIQTWEQYQYVHVALSRYARMLAGENVATPSTASSIRSPSSRHSTPASAGTPLDSSRGAKPPTATRLFSPRPFSKPELSTVDENHSPKIVCTDNILKDTENTQTSAIRADADRSIFSPLVVKSYSGSRFSFSCAVSPGRPAENSELSHVNGDAETESKPAECTSSHSQASDSEPSFPNGEESHSEPQKNSKRTKKSLPPHLMLKLNSSPTLARDENWLVNGRCAADEAAVAAGKPEMNGEHALLTSGHAEPPFTPTTDNKSSVVSAGSPDRHSDNADSLGEAHMAGCQPNGHCSPPASACLVQSEEKKLSIFTFPSPEK